MWQGLQAGKVYCTLYAVSHSELNIKASGSRLRFVCMSANNLSVMQDAACAVAVVFGRVCMMKLCELAKCIAYFLACTDPELKAQASGSKLRFDCNSEDNLTLVHGAACVASCCVCSACMAKLYKLVKYVVQFVLLLGLSSRQR